ncbi:MAG: hypothetical protein WDN28_23940 [Chthoniobacter sp.]
MGASAPRGEGRDFFDELVAGDEKFEGLRGIEALVLAGLIVRDADGGGELRGRVVELGKIFDDLVEGVELVLELAGVVQRLEVLIGVRDGGLAELDGVALFRGQGEVAILLQRLPWWAPTIS